MDSLFLVRLFFLLIWQFSINDCRIFRFYSFPVKQRSISDDVAGFMNKSNSDMQESPIVLQGPKRNLEFWSRTIQIYSSYKAFQLRRSLKKRIKGSSAVEDSAELNQLHDINSNRLLDLCLRLRGFYLKTGQFLATRHDILPQQYTSKLSQLQDSVPPLSEKDILPILQKEFNTTNLFQYFSALHLQKPIGSASIAQVHFGIWKATNEKVAIKIQNPFAETLILNDLKNLENLSKFLSVTKELPMNFLMAIKEFQKQIVHEFDFRLEAKNMDSLGRQLLQKVSNIMIPRSVFATKRVLVMSFIDGENLNQYAKRQLQKKTVAMNKPESKAETNSSTSFPSWTTRNVLLSLTQRKMKSFFQKKFLLKLSELYAYQIFHLKSFHADPHPGNICIQRRRPLSFSNHPSSSRQIGLLDWGQIKHLPHELVLKLSYLIHGIAHHDRPLIKRSFRKLGIIVHESIQEDEEMIEKLALTLFDTKAKPVKLRSFPAESNTKKNIKQQPKNLIESVPSDLFFIIRTIQLIRGITHSLGVTDFSLAEEWEPFATEFILKNDQTPRIPKHRLAKNRNSDWLGQSISLVKNSLLSFKNDQRREKPRNSIFEQLHSDTFS
jgi:aarF domain-containing kinase